MAISGHSATAEPVFGRRRAFDRRLSRPLSVAGATFAVYLAFVLCSIAHGYSASSFAFVGRGAHEPTSTLARYAPPGSTRGYDGQFALFVALDPTGARPALDSPAYRYSHILYPMLARAAAFGSPALIPAALLVINLLAVSIAAFAVARLLEVRCVSPWFACLVAFYPGMFLSVARDLNEPVAFALAALGVLVLDWGSARRVAAATALFAAAGLTRETTLIFPLALAACEAFRSRRLALPSLLSLAAIPYTAWYAALRYALPGGGRPPTFSHYPLEGVVEATQFRTFQLVFVVAPLLLLFAAVMMTLRHRAEWTPFAMILGVETALSVMLGRASFLEWTSSSRLQIGVLLAALLASPALRARPLQLAAAALAFAPTIPVILFMFATGPGPR